jgi:threonine aldolase
MAKLLEHGLRQIPQIKITQQVDGNGVFAIIPKKITEALQEEMYFYVWNEHTNECRLMCSFDSKEEEIANFIRKAKQLLEA